ncbi:MAG: phenylalanine--tRNA ligase subunit alpha [Thermosulfidibacteraceae bacterium]|jgi:phenylalanyl-tRNA synthetase alpha chain
MNIEREIEKIKEDVLKALEQIKDRQSLMDLKAKFVGKKGVISEWLKRIKDFGEEERPKLGKLLNEVKNYITELIEKHETLIKEREKENKLQNVSFDVTLPGRRPIRASFHPVTIVMDEIVEIFRELGFFVAEGPEIEDDFHNFEALNIPPDHPARDMQDTFYIGGGVLLRTHTSPVQIRVMESFKPPIRIIAPGKVYRRDFDITHSPMFHQVEGLYVDRNVKFSELKGTLVHFAKSIFGKNTKVRFRPSFFPFTEPSAEMDIVCVICKGVGCRVCKNSGWLEILGCGMVDPNVFEFVGYRDVTGFAFGLGVERIAMLKYGIDDIRLFYQNDLRFLKQFS